MSWNNKNPRKSVSKKGISVFQLVFDKTPFYAQGGGQVGDVGMIESSDKEQIIIHDTIKENDSIIHVADSLPKNLSKELTLRVNKKTRLASSSNHSESDMARFELL